jgi:signal peptidase I
LFSGRIFASEPRRGDVVVFRLPKDDRVDYVKRIVGLPGDRIQMKDGQLTINGAPVQREPLASFNGGDPCGANIASVKRWRETLDSGASYETLDCIDNGFYDNTNVYTVPQGHYFMMGDNRDNSTDSRVLSAVGYVPFENIVGRVGLIFPSREPGSGGVRSERVGTVVK